jgi:thiamine biosynthesis lipoprotein
MGTRFELVLPRGLKPTRPVRAFRPADLQSIGELVMAEIDDWHQRLNRFSPDSWVSHVNRTAALEPVRCDDDVWDLLVDAKAVWRDSDEAFDITRGDGDALTLDPESRTVSFGRAGMALDLGGIGKGHALDCCVRILRAHGITSAFCHGGTSSGIALGNDPAGHPWRVRTEPLALQLSLTDSAFSVSDAAGQALPHILNPRTGVPVIRDPGRAVVVTGPSARVCDAWSTAIVVLGRVPPQFPIGYAHAETAAG